MTLDPEVLDLLHGPDRLPPAERAAILRSLTDGCAPDLVLAWAALDPDLRPSLEAWMALHPGPAPPESPWVQPEGVEHG